MYLLYCVVLLPLCRCLLVGTGSRAKKKQILDRKSQTNAMTNDGSEDDSSDSDEEEKSQEALKKQRERKERLRRRDEGTS